MKDENLGDKVGSFIFDKVFVPVMSGIISLSEYFAIEGYERDECQINNEIIRLRNEASNPFSFMGGGSYYHEIYQLEEELEELRRYNSHKSFL